MSTEFRKLQAVTLVLIKENHQLREQLKDFELYKEIANNGFAKYVLNSCEGEDCMHVYLVDWFDKVLDIAYEASQTGVDEQDASCIEHDTIRMEIDEMISKVKSSCLKIQDLKIVYISSEILNYLRRDYNRYSCIQKALRESLHELLKLFTGAEEYRIK